MVAGSVNIDRLINYGSAMAERTGAVGSRATAGTTGAATGLLSSAEASRRLGVKPETLYAYVSRGLLRRERSPDGRRSWFDPAEVERLAERSRQPAARGAARLAVSSAITSIQGGRHRYRGVDATELARDRSFEEVAHWLWTAELPREPDWRADEGAVAVGRAAQATLPPDTLPLERLRVIVAAMATTDELRLQLDPSAVVAAGQSLIAGMVACLPDARPAARRAHPRVRPLRLHGRRPARGLPAGAPAAGGGRHRGRGGGRAAGGGRGGPGGRPAAPAARPERRLRAGHPCEHDRHDRRRRRGDLRHRPLGGLAGARAGGVPAGRPDTAPRHLHGTGQSIPRPGGRPWPHP